MSSKTRETIDIYIRDAEAVVMCPICSNYEVWADEAEAESMVYAKVTNAWKNGEFGTEQREKIMEQVKLALDGVNINCPSCGRA